MTVTREPLVPGVQSPRRSVPAQIARPEYVDRPAPERYVGPEVKDPDTIERMRVAGRIAGQALAEVGRAVAPGVTTDDLDRIGHEFLLDHGAYPSTLGYRGFPKSCCTSVNEVICHGIPDARPLEDGDLVKIDVTAFYEGVHGDNCATYGCGELDEQSQLLAPVPEMVPVPEVVPAPEVVPLPQVVPLPEVAPAPAPAPAPGR